MRSAVQNGWDQLRCFHPLFPFGAAVQCPNPGYLNLTRLAGQYTDLIALSK